MHYECYNQNRLLVKLWKSPEPSLFCCWSICLFCIMSQETLIYFSITDFTFWKSFERYNSIHWWDAVLLRVTLQPLYIKSVFLDNFLQYLPSWTLWKEKYCGCFSHEQNMNYHYSVRHCGIFCRPNLLTPKISLVIVLTVCYIVLVMLVWRIWYWYQLMIPWLRFFFILITCLLDIVLIL